MYQVDEVWTMKKPHPCGGREWKIVRIGADVKLQCRVCGKYINLTREELKKRAKSVAERGDDEGQKGNVEHEG